MRIYVSIRKNYGSFVLDTTFESEGGVLGILGASGCGKSMTLRCIAGIETPDEGKIVLNGVTLFDSGRRINLRPQQRKVGYVFQDYALFPHMTVRQNILCGIQAERSKHRREALAEQMIGQMLLGGQEDKLPAQLSGGQRQRVAAARALIGDPAIVLADEPTGALDSKSARNLLESMESMNQNYDATILMVTHDALAASFATRVIFLKDGQIFNEVNRGNDERKQFFERIMDVVTLMGGAL